MRQRNKLEQMASLENRSVSNLIEVMADERWKRFVICVIQPSVSLGEWQFARAEWYFEIAGNRPMIGHG